MHYLIIFGYLLVINIAASLVCVWDKYKARTGGWRVPEQTLFMLVFFGGGIGMYATMKAIRHKTRHKRFMIGIPLIIVMQILCITLVLYKMNVI